MPQLKSHQWWPTAWVSADGGLLTADEIRRNGVLKNVRRSFGSLTLVVDCTDRICTATVALGLSEDTLILPRHLLLQHYGEPMALVEDLDVDLVGVFPVVKSYSR